jgi:uncharacterized protein RhaS with RHS repeats
MTDANGLYYMRARYYNPYLKRFINADPAGMAGGMNWYAYADGNPISLLDPFGLGAQGENSPSKWILDGADSVNSALIKGFNTATYYTGAAVVGTFTAVADKLGFTMDDLLAFGPAGMELQEAYIVLKGFGLFVEAAEETGAAGSVFWSGRQGANRAAAESFAQATGQTTLEMTPAGQALEAAGGSISQWKALSADFAQGASGEVNAFVGGSRVNSVWNTVEKPILLQNSSVEKIIIQDATQPWKTTIIYK